MERTYEQEMKTPGGKKMPEERQKGGPAETILRRKDGVTKGKQMRKRDTGTATSFSGYLPKLLTAVQPGHHMTHECKEAMSEMLMSVLHRCGTISGVVCRSANRKVVSLADVRVSLAEICGGDEEMMAVLDEAISDALATYRRV
jgi:hypothetical protein